MDNQKILRMKDTLEYLCGGSEANWEGTWNDAIIVEAYEAAKAYFDREGVDIDAYVTPGVRAQEIDAAVVDGIIRDIYEKHGITERLN